MSKAIPSVVSYQRPPDEPDGGNHVIGPIERKPLYELHVDGHAVPYVRLGLCDPTAVIEDYGLQGLVKDGNTWRESREVKWASDDVYQHAIRMREAIERGEPLYILVLDEQFATTPIPEQEINRWAWFFANAMAVSAGYTSHGSKSRRRNPHGVSRK